MSTRNGNTLSLDDQADFYAAVIKALPRDIDPEIANGWSRNGKALTKAMREILIPPPETKLRPILRQLYTDDVITVGDRNMAVYEMAENADFVKMYRSLASDLEKLWLPVAQREAFCKEHHDKLRKGGYATFFLHKKDETKPAMPDNLEVAFVRVVSGGLYVRVDRFENDDVWRAVFQHRLVSP